MKMRSLGVGSLWLLALNVPSESPQARTAGGKMHLPCVATSWAKTIPHSKSYLWITTLLAL
jgi:hypothetical protein